MLLFWLQCKYNKMILFAKGIFPNIKRKIPKLDQPLSQVVSTC